MAKHNDPEATRIVGVPIDFADGGRAGFYATFVNAEARDDDELIDATAFHGRMISLALESPGRVEVLLEMQARDALTGCLTLADLDGRLAAGIESAESGGSPFSLCFLDLDRFKRINDREGHPRGNEVLAAVGARLRRSLSGQECACRFGGDEFLILIPGADQTEALSRAAAIRREVEAAGSEVGVGATQCSIGVTTWGPDTPAEEMIKRADLAMRVAKSSKGGIVGSDELGPGPRSQTRTENLRHRQAGLPTAGHAEGEELLKESRGRVMQRLSRHEWRAELIMAVGFVLAATAIAVLFPSQRSTSLGLVVALTGVFAVCARVRFEVGSCHTMPTQLAFVPMLLLLPAPMVPFLVALGFSLDKGVDIFRGRTSGSRGITVLADSWFSIGPALVLAWAGVGDPALDLWPIYVAALAAQFVGETVAAGVREWLHGGASGREQLLEGGWVYLVDALLSPIGLLVSLTALEYPGTVFFVLPLVGLLLIFARERSDHVDSMLALREAYRGTAYVLGDVVEYDDAYTGEHSKGVTDVALQTAGVLGLDAAAMRNVEFGAILHDVGKIAIPKRIVNKRGPLDEHEWALIKTHTIEAQRMLDRIGGLMSGIGTIVRSAHERYDGKGYPDGLEGEDIPIESRIIFACDAFNAMTTDRPYRRGRSPEQAMHELRMNAGTQFDPRVVDALLSCLEARERGAPQPVTERSAWPAPDALTAEAPA